MKTVMVVDDSRFVCEHIIHLLDDTEFEVVVCCRDAEEALECYGDHTPDAVLMDIVLPGMDGIEATEELLKKWPDAKVVVASSLAYEGTVEASSKSGAKGFLFKPLNREKMLEMLRGLIEG